jgi:sphingosine kinase
VHSFLEFEWAIVADIDLESEKYRFLGGLRFTVSAIKRIINLRLYRGRLSFLMFDDKETYTPKNNTIRLIKNTSNNSNTENGDETQTTPSIHLNNKPPFKYLPNSLDDPVPDNWVTIEENFVFFLVTYLPLIAPDFMAAPESSFNDQSMHLLFIKEGISKAQLLKLFTETEQGEHLNSPFVEYVKIKAFRLEPLPYIDKTKTNVTGNDKSNTDDGIMMIDGERVPYGKLQAEIIPGLGNILANKNF